MRTVVWIVCDSCGREHPVEPNQSPGVPRETRCQRCLVAELGRLVRAAVPSPQPFDYVAVLKDAKQIVNASVLYRRFIDGTPLENDIAVWMADFAAKHVDREVAVPSPPEGRPPTDEENLARGGNTGTSQAVLPHRNEGPSGR